MEDEEEIDRARLFGRVSLGFGLVGMVFPWIAASNNRLVVPMTLLLGLAGLLSSLPGLDARSEIEGPKPAEPWWGLFASVLALLGGAFVWFVGVALGQHGPR